MTPRRLVSRLLFALLLLSKTSSGQKAMEIEVREVYEVQAELPKQKTQLKALDGELRVALFLPAPQEEPSAYLVTLSPPGPVRKRWFTAPEVRVVDHGDFSAAKYQVALTAPFSERLRTIFQQLFPRTKLYREGDNPGPEEIRVHVRLRPEFIRGAESGLDGMSIQVALSIKDIEDHEIVVIEESGTGLPTKQMYWNLKNAWAESGTLALTQVFDKMIRDIQLNRTLRLHLEELAKDRALPAGIATTARFSDASAFLPNGRIDAGDRGIVNVQVTNQGPGPAYGVTVKITSDQPQIVLSGVGAIGDLKPGEKKEVALQVSSNLDLPTTVAQFRIETAEKRGYGAQPIILEVPTARLVPPSLEIVDIALNDQTAGKTRGDGDGQPANGETLEAIVRVRNAGPGEAVGIAVSLSAPKTAEVLEGKAVIPRIAVNQVGEARFLLRLPLDLPAGDLPLSFHAVEARGAQVATMDKAQSWKIRTKRPGIELAYRIYDGNSPGSTGNRDGLVSNGEKIEVAVTPTNRGELPARGVRITVEPKDAKLIPRPASFEIGDLPVQAEGVVQRFAFEVPRSYGKDQSPSDLRFTLNLSQQSFPARQEPLTLTFRALRPQLTLETSVPPALLRGGSGEMSLRLRNNGTLRAEDVVAEITSEASGVDLLDEHGVPVRSRKIVLGALDAQGFLPEQRVKVNVRRNAAIGPAPLRLTITQKDFSPLARDLPLTVTEEPATVIAAVPADDGPSVAPPALPAPSAPATISFLRNTQGEHLIAEAIVLRFEVQSPAGLDEVRLTQNDRRLPTDSARSTSGTAGGLLVEQYEIPVQLAEGENRFEVVAVTRQGLRSTRSLTLFRDPEVGRIWVVAIGVSQYHEKAIPSLQYADADAQAVANYFRDTFSLPENQVFLRVNAQATLREIKSVLGTQLAARANDPRDTVILYFAGHGMRERMVGSLDADGLNKYFLPYDAARDDLYSTALEMDEVTNILRRLTPERVVVLLDSCFSGAAGGRSPFDPRTEGERAPITGEFLDRMAHVGKGRVVLTAGGPEESAQESAELGHGVFTYYLLDGLRGAADLSGDGEIDVHEIYRYVSDKVSRATQGRQNPKLKEPDLVGRILLGRGAARGRR